MDWLTRMNRALDYLETHLEDKMDYEAVSAQAGCSVYHFTRLFSFIANIPLSEYVRRRKMTLAAFELQNTKTRVVDLALKYGYDSPESFTRAFQALHGVTPTAARHYGVGIKAYPRLSFQITMKGDTEMNYRIEEKGGFQVFGIEEIFDTADGSNLKEIPEFWGRLIKNGELDKLALAAGKPPIENLLPANAVCDVRDQQSTKFTYMICGLTTPQSKTEGYTVADVSAATWAIFKNEPHDIEVTSKAMQELSQRVYTDWLPTASYEIIPGYEMEMYFKNRNEQYYEETWVRVKPRG